MRLLIVICCTIFAFSVYSQKKVDNIVDSLPILKIDKKELVNTNLSPNAERKQDSFPRKTVQETFYQGRKIRIITEYTSP